MKISADIPDEYGQAILDRASQEEFGNCSAVIRKALSFYLFKKPRKAKNSATAKSSPQHTCAAKEGR